MIEHIWERDTQMEVLWFHFISCGGKQFWMKKKLNGEQAESEREKLHMEWRVFRFLYFIFVLELKSFLQFFGSHVYI